MQQLVRYAPFSPLEKWMSKLSEVSPELPGRVNPYGLCVVKIETGSEDTLKKQNLPQIKKVFLTKCLIRRLLIFLQQQPMLLLITQGYFLFPQVDGEDDQHQRHNLSLTRLFSQLC